MIGEKSKSEFFWRIRSQITQNMGITKAGTIKKMNKFKLYLIKIK